MKDSRLVTYVEKDTATKFNLKAKLKGHSPTSYLRYIVENDLSECEHEYIAVPINGIIHNQSAMCHKCGYVPEQGKEPLIIKHEDGTVNLHYPPLKGGVCLNSKLSRVITAQETAEILKDKPVK